MVKKYIAVVEAMQFVWGMFAFTDVQNFVGKDALIPYLMASSSDPSKLTIHVKTNKGFIEVNDKDFIVKGPNGDIFAVSPEEFYKIYQEAVAIEPSELTEEELATLDEEDKCCENEQRNFNGGCDNCDDPSY